jgi:hypothetical protein
MKNVQNWSKRVVNIFLFFFLSLLMLKRLENSPPAPGAGEGCQLMSFVEKMYKEDDVESLQSHMILTMSHWSSGLTCLFPATRVTGSNPLRGTYVKPGFSC